MQPDDEKGSLGGETRQKFIPITISLTVPRVFSPHGGGRGGARLSRDQLGPTGEQLGSGGRGKGQLPVVPLHCLALLSSAPQAEACDVEPVPSQTCWGLILLNEACTHPFPQSHWL